MIFSKYSTLTSFFGGFESSIASTACCRVFLSIPPISVNLTTLFNILLSVLCTNNTGLSFAIGDTVKASTNPYHFIKKSSVGFL